MATINRLMCYKCNLVLVTDKRVSKIFHLNEDEIKDEINKVIEKREATEPILIFKKAVENLLPEYTFGDIRRKNIVYGDEVCIHDQAFYRRCLSDILNNEIMKKREQRRKEKIQKRQEAIKENYAINGYGKENHERVMKRLRQHYPDKL